MTGTRHLHWEEGKGIIARKRFYQTLLFGSALLTAGIGVKAQTTYDDFEPISYGPVPNDRVNAYAEVVRLTEPIESRPAREVDPNEARAIARKWVQGMRSGKLRPLSPVAFEDSFDIPAKNEILSACSSLAVYLNRLASFEGQVGRDEEASQDALLVLELTSVLKYSDLQTVGAMALHQKKALRTLSENLSEVSQETQQEIRQKVWATWQGRNQERLSKLLALSRAHYVDYALRQHMEISWTELKLQGRSFPEASSHLTLTDLARSLKLSALARQDDQFPAFLSNVSYGYQNEAAVQEQATELLAQNNGPEH